MFEPLDPRLITTTIREAFSVTAFVAGGWRAHIVSQRVRVAGDATSGSSCCLEEGLQHADCTQPGLASLLGCCGQNVDCVAFDQDNRVIQRDRV